MSSINADTTLRELIQMEARAHNPEDEGRSCAVDLRWTLHPSKEDAEKSIAYSLELAEEGEHQCGDTSKCAFHRDPEAYVRSQTVVVDLPLDSFYPPDMEGEGRDFYWLPVFVQVASGEVAVVGAPVVAGVVAMIASTIEGAAKPMRQHELESGGASPTLNGSTEEVVERDGMDSVDDLVRDILGGGV